MLPDGSGFDVCRELRPDSQVPIIMLTARGDETDRVLGLELGADDYVTKPFSARELVARIRAVLRRTTRQAGASDAIEIDELRLDPARREVTREASRSSCRARSSSCSQLLMREAGTVVTRERLIDEVWDMNWFGSTKTLDVHVSGLRKKLRDDPAARVSCTRSAASASASRPGGGRVTLRRPAAGGLRLRDGAGAGRAAGAAGAQPVAPGRRRGEGRGRSQVQLIAATAAAAWATSASSSGCADRPRRAWAGAWWW